MVYLGMTHRDNWLRKDVHTHLLKFGMAVCISYKQLCFLLETELLNIVLNGIGQYRNAFNKATVIHKLFHKKSLQDGKLYFSATRAYHGTISLLVLYKEGIVDRYDTYALLDDCIDGFLYKFHYKEGAFRHIVWVVLQFAHHRNMAVRQKKH